MKTNSQQNERARTRKGDTISKEMSCPALKSKSNKRDGNSADRKLKELNDLREQNKQLRDLVELYNQGVSRIAMCSECAEEIYSNNQDITEKEKEQAIKRIEKNMPDNWRLNIG
jgi:hypothetical protein